MTKTKEWHVNSIKLIDFPMTYASRVSPLGILNKCFIQLKPGVIIKSTWYQVFRNRVTGVATVGGRQNSRTEDESLAFTGRRPEDTGDGYGQPSPKGEAATLAVITLHGQPDARDRFHNKHFPKAIGQFVEQKC